MDRTHRAGLLAWIATASMAACSAGDGAGKAAGEPVPEPGATGMSLHVRPGMDLHLDGTEGPDGSTVLVATIRLAAGLTAPPVVRLVLPEGAELAGGSLEEVLAAPGREVTYRREYRVRGSRGPIRVVVQSVGVARGLRVEATWPQPGSIVPAPAVQARPIPPTTVDGVRIDSAVPLDPGR